MTIEELQSLCDPKVLRFIEQHRDDDPSAFALKHHSRSDLPVRAMAEQIACRRKAAKKLPKLSRRNLLYTALSLEQASGERAASYKAGLVGIEGEKMLDMTGGLGIDSIFFAKRFKEVVYVERDEVLADIAAHNFHELGIENITVVRGDSKKILKSSPDDVFDWIFLDPARREKGKRQVGLEESEPNVVQLHDLLLEKAGKFCVKASPALDTGTLQEKLPSLSRILVISVDRECKETLLMCTRESLADVTNVVIQAVCLGAGTETIITSEKSESGRSIATDIGKYFYEPDPAIIKARLSVEVARHYDMRFINPQVDYLTSDRMISAFPGRAFRVKESVLYKPRRFRHFLTSAGISAASIQRRDFPLSPEKLRRMYALKEGAGQYLFFSKNSMGQLLCIYCEREA